MSYLVDASVAFKWFNGKEPLHAEALAFFRHSAGDLEAPDLILAEIANATWKKQIRGEIGVPQANIIVPALRSYIRVFHPTGSVIERALEIAFQLNHPVYDCLYLACIETTGRILVTDDRRLRRVVGGTRFDAFVQLLTDMP